MTHYLVILEGTGETFLFDDLANVQQSIKNTWSKAPNPPVIKDIQGGGWYLEQDGVQIGRIEVLPEVLTRPTHF